LNFSILPPCLDQTVKNDIFKESQECIAPEIHDYTMIKKLDMEHIKYYHKSRELSEEII